MSSRQGALLLEIILGCSLLARVMTTPAPFLFKGLEQWYLSLALGSDGSIWGRTYLRYGRYA